MVHIVALGRNSAPSFLYNLDGHVGTGRQNSMDDVEFVRLGYYSMSRNPHAGNLSSDLKTAIGQMKPSGAFGPDLDAVIRAHERSRGGAQDGVVSPTPPNTPWKGRYDANHQWIVEVLLANLHDVAGGAYPRIDMLTGCGGTLRARIQQIFTIPG